MEKVIANIGERELDYDKIIASMMVDEAVSSMLARETLDAFIAAGKLIQTGDKITLPPEEIIKLKAKILEEAKKDFKEVGLDGN